MDFQEVCKAKEILKQSNYFETIEHECDTRNNTLYLKGIMHELAAIRTIMALGSDTRLNCEDLGLSKKSSFCNAKPIMFQEEENE